MESRAGGAVGVGVGLGYGGVGKGWLVVETLLHFFTP